MAKGDHLGEFEQVVLLALAHFDDDAYGVQIFDEIRKITGRESSLTAVYMTLSRLEAKGFVASEKGASTPRRGGRAKRFYRLAPAGAKALQRSRRTLEKLWEGARLHPLLEDV